MRILLAICKYHSGPDAITVYIATTLDGFIARADGALDWLLTDAITDDSYSNVHLASSIDTVRADSFYKTAPRLGFSTLLSKLYICET